MNMYMNEYVYIVTYRVLLEFCVPLLNNTLFDNNNLL